MLRSGDDPFPPREALTAVPEAGILFDLDGTLLDLDVDAFLQRYFAAVDRLARERFPGMDLLAAILASTRAMQGEHGGRTNHDVFAEDLEARCGVVLDEAWPVFEEFYLHVFPSLRAGAGPAPGAREVVESAMSSGFRVAVATQPIFPRIAIEQRLDWAGLGDLPFDAVTTYETMEACKPRAHYFEQTSAMIGCDPRECLMVGDDPDLDMPARAIGMRTFYTGPGRSPADGRGTLRGLLALLRRDGAHTVSRLGPAADG